MKNKKPKVWTRFQPEVPCKVCQNRRAKHKACRLWKQGWRVGVRKFLSIKWLEFTHD